MAIECYNRECFRHSVHFEEGETEPLCQDIDDCIITKVTNNICPSCGGLDFEVEGSVIFCTSPGGCVWTHDFEEDSF